MSVLYKYPQYLSRTDSDIFDKDFTPGAITVHSGIYRCKNCGKEVTSVASHPLPPQNHHQHAGNIPIIWQLLVWA